MSAGESWSSSDREGRRLQETQQREGEAILALADAAVAGKAVPFDFEVHWQNEFLKAQRGTFVPFTLTIDASRLTRPSALVYLRAVARDTAAVGEDARRRGQPVRSETREAALPLDLVFAADLDERPGKQSRISRGFALTAGDYDVYVVVRERADPGAPGAEVKAAVLKQPLRVPEFGSGVFATSTVILADRVDRSSGRLAPEELTERPYVIGQSVITPAADREFRRDEELICVFLIYNPTVATDGTFDLLVEYLFYRDLLPGEQRGKSTPVPGTSMALEGEHYFNQTEPQRFNPAVLGSDFDPAAGQPVMAGQGISLAGFPDGRYRLVILITDLLSSRSLTKDVLFAVGS